MRDTYHKPEDPEPFCIFKGVAVWRETWREYTGPTEHGFRPYVIVNRLYWVFGKEVFKIEIENPEVTSRQDEREIEAALGCPPSEQPLLPSMTIAIEYQISQQLL